MIKKIKMILRQILVKILEEDEEKDIKRNFCKYSKFYYSKQI